MSKRVLQVRLDILVNESTDGDDLARTIRTELEEYGLGLTILGAWFQQNLTDQYRSCYPNTMNELVGTPTKHKIKLSGNMVEIPIEPKED